MAPPPNPPRRRAAAIALTLLAIAAVTLLFLRRSRTPSEPTASSDPSFAPLPPPSVVGPLAPRSASMSADAPPPNNPDDPPLVGPDMSREAFNRRKADVTREALKSLELRINYPLWSSPLTENMQYKTPVPAHPVMAGDQGAYPKLEIYTEKLNYKKGDSIRVYALAHGPNGPIGFDALSGYTIGQVRPRPRIDLTWNEQPDGTSMAELALPSDVADANRGEWGVTVDCEIQGQHRILSTQFYLMGANADVTGPYRVAIEEGSLAVYATVSVHAKAQLHLKGELWSAKGDPVAYAWVRNDDAQPGNIQMRLLFYGKTIRDSGADGPYVVKNLLLTEFDANADRITNDPVDPQLTTPPFKRDQFTDVPINGNNDALSTKKTVLQGELSKAEGNGYDPQNPGKVPIIPKPRAGTPPPQ